MRNNLFVALNDEGFAAVSSAGATNLTIENNVFWPTADLGPASADQRCDPLLVSYAGVALGSGSCALDAVAADPEAGPLDIYGQARSQGSQTDIGPVEIAGQTAAGAIGRNLSVGPTAAACPDGCTFDASSSPLGAGVLHEVLSAAPPGATITLFDDQGAVAFYDADALLIDRPLTLQRDPAAAVDNVHLVSSGTATALGRGMVIVTQGEGVRIEGLAFDCNANCVRAIWIDEDRPAGANGTQVIANHMRALSSVGVDGFVRMGNDSVVRQNLAEGLLQGFAQHAGVGGEVIFNTWLSDLATQNDQIQIFRLEGSQALTIANNLVDARTASDADGENAAALVDTLTSGTTLTTNRFYNVNKNDDGPVNFTELDIIANGNCTTNRTDGAPALWCDPTFPDFVDFDGGDYEPRSTSAAHDAGDPTYVLPGETDFRGCLLFEATPNIGAFTDTTNGC